MKIVYAFILISIPLKHAAPPQTFWPNSPSVANRRESNIVPEGYMNSQLPNQSSENPYPLSPDKQPFKGSDTLPQTDGYVVSLPNKAPTASSVESEGYEKKFQDGYTAKSAFQSHLDNGASGNQQDQRNQDPDQQLFLSTLLPGFDISKFYAGNEVVPSQAVYLSPQIHIEEEYSSSVRNNFGQSQGKNLDQKSFTDDSTSQGYPYQFGPDSNTAFVASKYSNIESTVKGLVNAENSRSSSYNPGGNLKASTAYDGSGSYQEAKESGMQVSTHIMPSYSNREPYRSEEKSGVKYSSASPDSQTKDSQKFSGYPARRLTPTSYIPPVGNDPQVNNGPPPSRVPPAAQNLPISNAGQSSKYNPPVSNAPQSGYLPPSSNVAPPVYESHKPAEIQQKGPSPSSISPTAYNAPISNGPPTSDQSSAYAPPVSNAPQAGYFPPSSNVPSTSYEFYKSTEIQHNGSPPSSIPPGTYNSPISNSHHTDGDQSSTYITPVSNSPQSGYLPPSSNVPSTSYESHKPAAIQDNGSPPSNIPQEGYNSQISNGGHTGAQSSAYAPPVSNAPQSGYLLPSSNVSSTTYASHKPSSLKTDSSPLSSTPRVTYNSPVSNGSPSGGDQSPTYIPPVSNAPQYGYLPPSSNVPLDLNQPHRPVALPFSHEKPSSNEPPQENSLPREYIPPSTSAILAPNTPSSASASPSRYLPPASNPSVPDTTPPAVYGPPITNPPRTTYGTPTASPPPTAYLPPTNNAASAMYDSRVPTASYASPSTNPQDNYVLPAVNYPASSNDGYSSFNATAPPPYHSAANGQLEATVNAGKTNDGEKYASPIDVTSGTSGYDFFPAVEGPDHDAPLQGVESEQPTAGGYQFGKKLSNALNNHGYAYVSNQERPSIDSTVPVTGGIHEDTDSNRKKEYSGEQIIKTVDNLVQNSYGGPYFNKHSAINPISFSKQASQTEVTTANENNQNGGYESGGEYQYHQNGGYAYAPSEINSNENVKNGNRYTDNSGYQDAEVDFAGYPSGKDQIGNFNEEGQVPEDHSMRNVEPPAKEFNTVIPDFEEHLSFTEAIPTEASMSALHAENGGNTVPSTHSSEPLQLVVGAKEKVPLTGHESSSVSEPSAESSAKGEEGPNYFVTYYQDTPKYRYRYEVNDSTTGDFKSHEEERDGEVTKGRYQLREPDGRIRTVDYEVNGDSGFKAVVKTTGSSMDGAPTPQANKAKMTEPES